MINLTGKDLRDFVGCIVEFIYYDKKTYPINYETISMKLKPLEVYAGSTYKGVIVFANQYNVYVSIPSTAGIGIVHEVDIGAIINITAAPTGADLLLKEL